MTGANAVLKRLFPYTRALAMRLWWNLVSLWYIHRANKAHDKLELVFDKANVLKVIAQYTSERADEWDAEVQRMRGQK
jgi:hypothetical protein